MAHCENCKEEMNYRYISIKSDETLKYICQKCHIKEVEEHVEQRTANREAITSKLDLELKKIKTWKDFVEFKNKLDNIGFTLCGKQRGYEAFGFTLVKHSAKDRVHYLYNDGVSSGESYVENLYKILEVR